METVKFNLISNKFCYRKAFMKISETLTTPVLRNAAKMAAFYSHLIYVVSMTQTLNMILILFRDLNFFFFFFFFFFDLANFLLDIDVLFSIYIYDFFYMNSFFFLNAFLLHLNIFFSVAYIFISILIFFSWLFWSMGLIGYRSVVRWVLELSLFIISSSNYFHFLDLETQW